MHYRVYVCDVCVLTAVLCITEDFFVDVVSSPAHFYTSSRHRNSSLNSHE